MIVQSYHILPEEAIKIRTEVFIQEQGFQNEFNEIDLHAQHFVVFDLETPVATCRVFPTSEPGIFMIGRVAVRLSYRKKGIGHLVMSAAEENIRQSGGHCIRIFAQLQAQNFYSALGYHVIGSVFDDEGCPHIRMEKQL